jgi:hypothetical protein
MRCFVKNRKKQLLAALAKTEDPSEIERIRERLSNVTIGPSNTVLWPRVQHIIEMLYNPKISDEDREFYTNRYTIFTGENPPITDPAQEIANDQNRMHNMYKERRKTLLRQLEKERDPQKVRDIQDQLERVRREPVRPSNVVLWKIVQDLEDIIRNPRKPQAERDHAARRYYVYMKKYPDEDDAAAAATAPTTTSTTNEISECIARHYSRKREARAPKNE